MARTSTAVKTLVSRSNAKVLPGPTPKLRSVEAMIENEPDVLPGEKIAGFPTAYAFVLKIICWHPGATPPELVHLSSARGVPKDRVHFIAKRLLDRKLVSRKPAQTGYYATDTGMQLIHAWDLLRSFGTGSQMQRDKFRV